jgi:hypothetical protein
MDRSLAALPTCEDAPWERPGSTSCGTSLGGRVTIRPTDLTWRLAVSRAGCQARMGVIVEPAAALEAGVVGLADPGKKPDFLPAESWDAPAIAVDGQTRPAPA